MKLGTTILLACWFAASALAQDQGDPASMRDGLNTLFSTLSLGAVSVPAAPVGGDTHFSIPLKGFAAPQDAAAEVTATQGDDGAWNITSLTFPQSGALGDSIDRATSYTIRQQSIHGRLDPVLAGKSSLDASLEGIDLQSVSGGIDSSQTVGRIHLDGSVIPTDTGLVDVLARGSAGDLHGTVTNPASGFAVHHLDSHLSASGVDRAAFMHLLAASEAWRGRPGPATARNIVAATSGLLSHIEADQIADGISFSDGAAANAIGRLKIHLNGHAQSNRFGGEIDGSADDLALAAMPVAAQHVVVRSVLAGLDVRQLTALLQTAMLPNADQQGLLRQANALLAAPGAKAQLQSVVFDAGPLHVHGSANFLSRPSGDLGADIHVSATGVDEFLQQASSNKALRRTLPFIVIARALGKVQGDSLEWDVSLGGGPPVINGSAFGGPPAKVPGH